ncbi:hypothetical protein [Kordiimonas pumila]|uniref:PEP-CTERM protein-sorting domain-containing protein n=1 Tax=Kordiimonas pumila TaxID=2161677 RepID=A0ABV7D0Y1_9PROT|nr:hypothetical protein [Kordiimonas pumila]
MKKYLAPVLKFAAAASLAVAFVSNSASAGYIIGHINAEESLSDTVELGTELTLNACGSGLATSLNLDAVSYDSYYDVCGGINNLANFTFNWTVYFDSNNNGTLDNIERYVLPKIVYTVAGVAISTVETGISNYISTVGTYFVGLNVTVNPDSTELFLYDGNSGFIEGGANYNSDSTPDLFSLTVTPSSVPEPAAAFLLLPGLIFMARRQQRRRATARSAA